jgi:hypothetical protein
MESIVVHTDNGLILKYFLTCSIICQCGKGGQKCRKPPLEIIKKQAASPLLHKHIKLMGALAQQSSKKVSPHNRGLTRQNYIVSAKGYSIKKMRRNSNTNHSQNRSQDRLAEFSTEA